jgi:hypothetical protein
MQIIRSNQTENGQPGIRKGTVPFVRYSSDTADITSLDFLRVDFRFVVDYGQGDFAMIYPGLYDYNSNTTGGIDLLTSKMAYPNIWVYADSLAKSAYSTILIDLGQNSTSPNILTNATALQFYTELFPKPPFIANAHPGPATEDYDTLKATTGQLGTTPSTIRTEYLCQVPQRKSTSNLFISVLVADLVLLHTLWQLLILGTDYIFLRKIPEVQYCEGCAAKIGTALQGYDHIRQDTDTLEDGSDEVALSVLNSTTKLKSPSFTEESRRSVSEQSLLHGGRETVPNSGD